MSTAFAQTADVPSVIAWNCDGTRLAVGYLLGEVVIVNAQTGDMVFTDSSLRIVTSLEWSPTQPNILAVAGYFEALQGVVRIIDTVSGATLYVLDGGQSVGAIAWNPDGSEIAAASNNLGPISRNEVQVWNTNTGALVTQAMSSVESITSITWNPDGTQIAGATASSTIFIWNVTTGEVIHELTGHTDVVLSVAWSPDGNRIASTSSTVDNTLRIWNTVTGENIAIFPSHFGTVKWNPDGSQLAVGESHSLRVLNANSGYVEFSIETDGLTQALAYSPYGGRLAFSAPANSETMPALGGSDANLADLSLQIVVPDPSLGRLHSIAALCAAPLPLPDAAQVDQLREFVAQVEALPAGSIPPACAADLIAVARAIPHEQ
jgi:WD40 repeat protein